MSAPLILLMLGVILFILGVYFLWQDGDRTFPIVLMILGLGMIVAGAGWAAQQEEDDCHARGGRMVPDGAPYYIKSGDVLVPSQPMKCEVP